MATHRDPDPLFLHFWWSPIARVPAVALLLGSLGLTLLVSTGLAGLLARMVRPWRPVPQIATAGLALLLTVVAVGGWATVAWTRADTSSTAMRAALSHPSRATPTVAPQAAGTIRLSLVWPGFPRGGVRILNRSTVPAGPWLVQTTEVLNENLQDESADVTVETLVNPVTGKIEAAWYYGL